MIASMKEMIHSCEGQGEVQISTDYKDEEAQIEHKRELGILSNSLNYLNFILWS